MFHRVMRRLLIAGIVVAVLLVGYLYRYPILGFFASPNKLVEVSEAQQPTAPAHRFAVAIDNAPEARPQGGLLEADVVIEALAEGVATRYLAFFQSQAADRIGPVRSVRPYFLDWALGFDAVIVHSGGSTEALARIRADRSIKDIDEFYNSQYIRRDSNKPRPHNLFTSSALLTEKAESMGWEEIEPSYGWPVKTDEPVTATATESVLIDFSGSERFVVRYDHDQTTNSYIRYLGGVQQFPVKNVILMETTSTLLDSKLLTIDLKTIGSGKAMIFQDGRVLNVRWRKQGQNLPLEFLDADGTRVAMNKGPVWIEVLDQFGKFSTPTQR